MATPADLCHDAAEALSVTGVEAAYRHCERVTRLRAGNFYYGIRLLPPDKREAMCTFPAQIAYPLKAAQLLPRPLYEFVATRSRSKIRY